MKNLKVVKIDSESIEFENGIKLYSEHQSDCCEHHYLSFEDLELSDFEDLEFDSITIAPYMGKDSVEPFLAFQNKHTILLALTSNAGAYDFQTKKIAGQELYKEVLKRLEKKGIIK